MSAIGLVTAMTAIALGIGIGMIIVLIGVFRGGAFCGGAPPLTSKSNT